MNKMDKFPTFILGRKKGFFLIKWKKKKKRMVKDCYKWNEKITG